MMIGRSGYGIYGSVQHHSASTLQGLIYRFTHPPAVSGGGASAHFAIDREEETRDGLLGFGQYAIRYQLVDTADMAYADADYWENLTTVAVEHVRQWGGGPGTPGYEPITDAQYRSSHELQLILSADNGYPLNASTITPHNLYAQTTCPGDLDLTQIIAGPTGGGLSVTDQEKLNWLMFALMPSVPASLAGKTPDDLKHLVDTMSWWAIDTQFGADGGTWLRLFARPVRAAASGGAELPEPSEPKTLTIAGPIIGTIT